LDPSRHSVDSEHIKNLNHLFDWDNVKILNFKHNFHKRLILEMIYIKEQKNNINYNKITKLLTNCCSYFILLNELIYGHF